MGTDQDREYAPIGPGGSTTVPEPAPSFEADPAEWFRWIDAAVAAGRPIEAAARAASWTDAEGRTWRVVISTEGLEVRPSFGAMAGEVHDQPMVAALLITPPLVQVELAWRTGQEVTRFGVDEVSLCDIGLAMLTGTELPHESVPRAGQDTWQRAHQRWRELVDRPSRDRVS